MGMLEGNEKKLSEIIESLNDAVFILSSEGNFIDVNRIAYERLGYSREEMLSMHITQLDPPEFSKQVPERLKEIRRKGAAVFESAHLRKDGTPMPVEVNSRIIDFQGKKAYLSVIRDITERKRAQKDLEESEEKYQKLFNNEVDAICIFRIEDRRLLDMNQAWLNLYGYTREEALQLSADDCSAEPGRTKEAIKKSAATGDMLIPVRHHRKKDGTKFWVELAAGPFTWKGEEVMFAVARDITARLDSERALHESEARFRAIVETTNEWIWSCDAQGVHTYSNRSIRDMLGYEPEEVVGNSALDLMHPDDKQLAAKHIQEALELQQGWSGLIIRWRHKDGTYRSFESTASPIDSNDGSLLGWYGADRDITDRLKAEEDLKQQNVELKRLDELKDGLIRDVSHELKTPVVKQTMHLEMLRAQLGEDCTQRTGRILKVMESCIRRQEKVIQNVLNLSRLHGDNVDYPLSPTRLDQSIQKVIDDNLLLLQEKGVEISAELAPLTTRGNEELLWHVFENLIGNALKFRAKGRESRVEVSLAEKNGTATAIIADNGVGLRSEHLPRVCDRFFQATASIEGSGIGLAFCRETLKMMGATISLESPGEGKGTTVVVVFPLIESALPPVS
jgi:PAS domain S-box-containing protein